MTTPISDPTTPHTVEGLLRVIEERDAEAVLPKLMVDKLKLQLLHSLRARFGSSSGQLDDSHFARMEGEPLYERPAPIAAAVPGHASVKDLIAQLEEATDVNDMFNAKVKVLGEYMDHHVKEERDDIFSKACKRSRPCCHA